MIRRPKVRVMAHKKKGKGKTFASRRTMNPPEGGPTRKPDKESTKGFQEQDAARRLGNFETAGEHARTGNRGR